MRLRWRVRVAEDIGTSSCAIMRDRRESNISGFKVRLGELNRRAVRPINFREGMCTGNEVCSCERMKFGCFSYLRTRATTPYIRVMGGQSFLTLESS